MADQLWVRANDKPAVRTNNGAPEGTAPSYVPVEKHVVWEVDPNHPGNGEIYVGPGTPPALVARTARVNDALARGVLVESSETEYRDYFPKQAEAQLDALEREHGASGEDLRKQAMDRVLAERGYVPAEREAPKARPAEAVAAVLLEDEEKRGPGRPKGS